MRDKTHCNLQAASNRFYLATMFIIVTRQWPTFGDPSADSVVHWLTQLLAL